MNIYIVSAVTGSIGYLIGRYVKFTYGDNETKNKTDETKKYKSSDLYDKNGLSKIMRTIIYLKFESKPTEKEEKRIKQLDDIVVDLYRRNVELDKLGLYLKNYVLEEEDFDTFDKLFKKIKLLSEVSSSESKDK